MVIFLVKVVYGIIIIIKIWLVYGYFLVFIWFLKRLNWYIEGDSDKIIIFLFFIKVFDGEMEFWNLFFIIFVLVIGYCFCYNFGRMRVEVLEFLFIFY